MKEKKNPVTICTDDEMMKKYRITSVQQWGRVYSDYERLKRRILREFPKKKLVGDIAISDEEFGILIEYLQFFYEYLRIFDWVINSDILVCVAMVQIGIRYYDGKYWPHFARFLRSSVFNGTHQAIMGKIFMKTLVENGKYILDENDRISTVLMHGFVANKYASNLFDFLSAYYRIDLERDLSRNDRDMMRELIRTIQNKDNTNRTYKLVQQTSDAVSQNQRGCSIRLRWLLRLIDASFWEEEMRVNPENRLVKQFNTWAEGAVELQREKGERGTRPKIYSSPHIIFNPQEGEFNIWLPSQLVRTEHDITLKYSFGDTEQTCSIDAYESVLAYKTENKTLSIDASDIFNRLTFDLQYGDTVKSFSVPKENVRFFNKSGFSVNITSIKAGEYYAFSNNPDALSSTALVEKSRRNNLWFYYLDFEEGDILKTVDGSVVCIGKKVEEGLLSKGRVHGVTEAEENLPVFSRIPSCIIQIPESRLPGSAISVNGKKARLQDACEITKLELKDGTDNSGFWFNFADIGCEQDGKYEIIVDVPNDRTVRQWKFVLIKEFDYTFDDRAPYIFETRGTLRIITN